MSSTAPITAAPRTEEVHMQAGNVVLRGLMTIPDQAIGAVIFVHGSGSSRFSPRNRRVAQALQRAGMGTLLFDLMTATEESEDAFTAHLRFDIDFLTGRLLHATQWARSHPAMNRLSLGYFGASTGAAAALAAAAQAPDDIRAIVSRGGRPDLAERHLNHVHAATLLIVGGADSDVIPLNEYALEQIPGPKRLEIVPGATHLFEEPETLDTVAQLAAAWFRDYL